MNDEHRDTDRNEEKQSLIEFPCNFPIKIFGKAAFEFESTVVTIIRKHIPDLSEGALQLKTSAKGHYLSITASVYVESQVQLDELYRELVASECVIMVL